MIRVYHVLICNLGVFGYLLIDLLTTLMAFIIPRVRRTDYSYLDNDLTLKKKLLPIIIDLNFLAAVTVRAGLFHQLRLFERSRYRKIAYS